MMNCESFEEKETSRTEAFSDAIFAFAITLLVLDLRDPTGGGDSLLQGLLHDWQSFFALVTSFVTVLIMWMNHHNMFNYIRRIDRRMMLLNGLLFLFVILTPFTTSLIANHITAADAKAAAAVYAGNFLFLAIVWNGLWWYCSNGMRLLGRTVTQEQARSISRQYVVAPVSYGSALVLAQFSGLASVILVFGVAAFFAITATMSD